MHSTHAKLPEKAHGFRLKKTGRQKRLEAISPLKVATLLPFIAGDTDDTFFWGLLDTGHPISLSAASSIAKQS